MQLSACLIYIFAFDRYLPSVPGNYGFDRSIRHTHRSRLLECGSSWRVQNGGQHKRFRGLQDESQPGGGADYHGRSSGVFGLESYFLIPFLAAMRHLGQAEANTYSTTPRLRGQNKTKTTRILSQFFELRMGSMPCTTYTQLLCRPIPGNATVPPYRAPNDDMN